MITGSARCVLRYPVVASGLEKTSLSRGVFIMITGSARCVLYIYVGILDMSRIFIINNTGESLMALLF
jgi:hypothetical protein